MAHRSNLCRSLEEWSGSASGYGASKGGKLYPTPPDRIGSREKGIGEKGDRADGPIWAKMGPKMGQGPYGPIWARAL